MPTSLGYAGWAALAVAAVKVAASVLLSYVVSSIFAKKPPKDSGLGEAQDRLITIRQPAGSGRVIFGRIRVGGTFDFLHTSTYSTDNYAVTTQDYVIPQSSGLISVAPIHETLSVVALEYDNTSESYIETPFVQGSVNPTPGEWVLGPFGYQFNRADENKSIRITYSYVATTTVSRYLHIVIELACHKLAEIGDIYFDDELIPLQEDGFGAPGSRLYGGWVYVSKHLGTADQVADPSLMFYAPDKWTAAHRGRGVPYIYVRILRDRDKFPNGMPNNITAVVKGYEPYDPRTGLRVWSDNWALCRAAYLTDTRFGLGHGYATEIDEPLLIAAANVSDEAVALAGGGTERRYTCNGSFLTSDQPKDILGRMDVAGSGKTVRIGGKWRIYAGAYITPTVTLTEDSLRGPIQVRPRLSGRDLFNRVKGVYVSEANTWQPGDFPAVTNATYLAEDDGEPKWLDMDLQYTTSPATAQRLAKIELEKVRQQIIVVMPCKLAAYRLEPPRTVMVTLPQFGWTSKVFEVVQTDLVVDVDDTGAPYVGVDVTLRETAAAVWDWNSGLETTVDLAPDTNLPNPFEVAPPGVPSIREEFYETAGRVAVRLLVEWAASGDGQARTYEVEWEAREFSDAPIQQHIGLTRLNDVIENVSTGLYDVRVRARGGFTASAWKQTRYEVIGLSAPLATPVIKGLRALSGLAILMLEPHPDLRVRVSGHWIIRHTEDPSAPVWEESFSIGEERGYPGAGTVVILPLKAGSYLVKADDGLGHLSAGYADAQTNQATLLTFSPVDLVVVDPTLHRVHAHTVLSAGVLKLDAAGLIDDVADWDSIESLDALGGIELDGTYTFAAGMDFTTVKRVRLIGHIEGITVNEFDLIDDRGLPIDEWLDFDGTAGGGSADAWLEARQTDDDPAVTPTWGAWMRMDASEVVCRALQFRLRLMTNDPAYNIHIDKLSVVAERL